MTAPCEKVLVMGATGTLGRPVVRRLIQEGFFVRGLSRDPDRARTLLPEAVEVMPGDYQEPASLETAMEGMDAVYINLSSPIRPDGPDPVRDAPPVIVEAARKTGIKRLAAITLMGVDDKETWWPAQRKWQLEACLRESGIPWTLFRPTWFMESIPQFIQGRFLLCFHGWLLPIFWIAGDDFARMVAKAFRLEDAAEKVYFPQGYKAIEFRIALEQFRDAYDPNLKLVNFPMFLTRLGGAFSPELKFLYELLQFTARTNMGMKAQSAWFELAKPEMGVADYVQYMRETGDIPSR